LAYSLPHAVYADAPIKGSLSLAPFETIVARPGDLPPEAWVTMEVLIIYDDVPHHSMVYAQETEASWTARMDRKWPTQRWQADAPFPCRWFDVNVYQESTGHAATTRLARNFRGGNWRSNWRYCGFGDEKCMAGSVF
jgi:hypothetical protein